MPSAEREPHSSGREEDTRDWKDQHLWSFRPVRDLLVFLGIALVLWAGYQLRSVLTPVLIGLVLAYLFNPLIDAAEAHWKAPRSVTAALILLAVLAATGGLIAWLGPLVVQQFQMLIENLPRYLTSMPGEDGGAIQARLGRLARRLEQQPASMVSMLSAVTSWAFGFVGQLLNVGVYLTLTTVLIPIYFFLFALHFHPMLRRVAEYIPRSKRSKTLSIVSQMDDAVHRFFRSRVVVAVISSGLYALGWSPWTTEVPYWLLLAVISGLLSLIPYAAALGWFAALTLKSADLTLTAAGTAAWVWGLGGPTFVFFAIQLIEGWILIPWVQGRSMEMSALTVLVVIFIGGAIAGLYGMILAVPVVACSKILIRETFLPRLAEWARQH